MQTFGGLYQVMTTMPYNGGTDWIDFIAMWVSFPFAAFSILSFIFITIKDAIKYKEFCL